MFVSCSRTHFGVNETTEALGGGAPMLTQTHNSLKYNNHDNRPLSWFVFLNAFACFLAKINLSVHFSSQPREIISCWAASVPLKEDVCRVGEQLDTNRRKEPGNERQSHLQDGRALLPGARTFADIKRARRRVNRWDNSMCVFHANIPAVMTGIRMQTWLAAISCAGTTAPRGCFGTHFRVLPVTAADKLPNGQPSHPTGMFGGQTPRCAGFSLLLRGLPTETQQFVSHPTSASLLCRKKMARCTKPITPKAKTHDDLLCCRAISVPLSAKFHPRGWIILQPSQSVNQTEYEYVNIIMHRMKDSNRGPARATTRTASVVDQTCGSHWSGLNAVWQQME